MFVFGYLTYENIRRTQILAEERADRQLTRMMFIQVLLVVTSMTPYGVYIAYSLATANNVTDSNTLLKEYFIGTFLSSTSYFYYTVCLFCHFSYILFYFLGKFLHVFNFIRPFSSNGKRSNILVEKTKSNNFIADLRIFKTRTNTQN